MRLALHALQVHTQIHSTGDGWYITEVNDTGQARSNMDCSRK